MAHEQYVGDCCGGFCGSPAGSEAVQPILLGIKPYGFQLLPNELANSRISQRLRAERKTVFGMVYLPEQIIRLVVSASKQEPFRHCYWARQRMAVRNQDRRTFPELVVLSFCQGDGHMVASYKQIAMP